MADSTDAEKRIPFYCDVEGCPKQFHPYTRREKLNEHIHSQHTGSRLQCPVCNKLIIRRGDLKKHMRASHEGYKPFVCEVGPANQSGCACGARFTKKSSLNRHQRPWLAYGTLEKVGNGCLSRDISDLRKTPELWSEFVEVVESSIIKEGLHLSSESSDGLLALCADTTVDIEAKDTELQSRDGVNEQVSRDDVETDLYLRLVRLFRRRGPKTCSKLLEDVLTAFKDSEHQYTKLMVNSSAFLEQILATLAANRLSPPGVVRVSIEEYDCIIWSSSWTNLARILGAPWVELVGKDRPFFEAHSEIVAQWIQGIRRREVIGSHRHQRVSESVMQKLLGSVQEAFTAASYCKSVASGHTNSTLESVGSIPSIFGNVNAAARPKLDVTVPPLSRLYDETRLLESQLDDIEALLRLDKNEAQVIPAAKYNYAYEITDDHFTDIGKGSI